MKLNADIQAAAMVHGAQQPWVDSPLPGVARRMLERDGDEVARVTSIVRYAPGSSFAPHTHDGGEEFFVLAGTFADEHGRYPQGTYVRNPIGTRHTPCSEQGCVLLVKLHWMLPDDQQLVVIDTHDQTRWATVDGIDTCTLHEFADETNVLLQLTAGAYLPRQHFDGGEELFVIEGQLRTDDGTALPMYTWKRTPPGQRPALSATDDTCVYIKRGHLNRIAADPANQA